MLTRGLQRFFTNEELVNAAGSGLTTLAQTLFRSYQRKDTQQHQRLNHPATPWPAPFPHKR